MIFADLFKSNETYQRRKSNFGKKVLAGRVPDAEPTSLMYARLCATPCNL